VPPPCNPAPQQGYGQPYGQPPYQQPPPYQPQPYPQQQQPPPYQPQQQQASAPASTNADDDDSYYAYFVDLVSLRVGTYDIRGSDADKRTWGFLFSMDPDVVQTEGYFTHRSTFFGAIGGGTDGFEGELTLSSRAGVRGYLGEDHGPFARMGLALQLLGNNKLYRSQIDLPTLEMGYQLMNDSILLEVAATGGLVLGGRYFTGDAAERRIDTEFEWGGAFTLQTDAFRAVATATRIEARQTGPGTPIDQLQGHICANPFEMVLLCAHGAFHAGDVELPDGRFSRSTATYFGGTIGIGAIGNGGGSGP
jgi:hypothetical protein